MADSLVAEIRAAGRDADGYQPEQEAAAFFNVLQPALPALREARGSTVAVTTAATRRYSGPLHPEVGERAHRRGAPPHVLAARAKVGY